MTTAAVSISNLQRSQVEYVAITRMAPISHPPYSSTSLAFASIKEGLDLYNRATNFPPITMKESYSVPTCCGFSSEQRERTVFNHAATMSAIADLLKRSLVGFNDSLNNVHFPKEQSQVHTSLAIVHDELGRIDNIFERFDDASGHAAMRAGHITRACELDPDNIPARGVKTVLDKVELRTLVSMSSFVQAIATSSAQANAKAKVDAR